MSDLGKLWFSLGLKDSTEDDYKAIKANIERKLKEKFNVGIDPSIDTKKIEEALKNVNQKLIVGEMTSSFDDMRKSIAEVTTSIGEMNKALLKAKDTDGSKSEGRKNLTQIENVLNRIAIAKVKALRFEPELRGIKEFDQGMKMLDDAQATIEAIRASGGKLDKAFKGTNLSKFFHEVNLLLTKAKEINKLDTSNSKKNDAEKKKNLKEIESVLNRISNVQSKILPFEFELGHIPEFQQALDLTKKMNDEVEKIKQSGGVLDDAFKGANLTRALNEISVLFTKAKEVKKLEKSSKNVSDKEEERRLKDIEKALKQVAVMKGKVFPFNFKFGGIPEFEKAKILLNEIEKEILEVQAAGGKLSDNQKGVGLEIRMQEIKNLMTTTRQSYQDVDKFNDSLNETGNKFNLINKLGGELRNQLSNAFSIYAAERFLRNVVMIGGEFEKQRIALTAIIGESQKAEIVYERIKNLAVESPFEFKDLASYTKQLAAFSVPYNELYETTRRLADMSAGLGVDMSRLVLAFGQVRSASVLKGTELRQFTEAGVPLVEELARKFTELTGKVVSVGDVFDMISRKAVSFEVVKDVLWELTEEGGKFYNMQEKLASSLAGKVSNLTDALHIMYSEIAEGNSGPLHFAVETLTKMTKHWKVLYAVIKDAAISYGVLKVAMFGYMMISGSVLKGKMGLAAASRLAAVSLLGQATGQQRLNDVTARGVLIMNKFSKTISKIGKTNLLLTLVTTIGGIIWGLIEANKKAEEFSETIGESIANSVEGAEKSASAFRNLVESLKNATEGTKEYNDIINKIQSQYGDHIQNINLETNAYNNLKNSVDGVTESIRRKAMEEAMDKGTQKINEKYYKPISEAKDKLTEALKQSNYTKDFANQLTRDLVTDLNNALSKGLSDVKPDSVFENILHKYNIDELPARWSVLIRELYGVIKSQSDETKTLKKNLLSTFNLDDGQIVQMLTGWRKAVTDYIGTTSELLDLRPKNNEGLFDWIKRVQEEFDSLTKNYKTLTDIKGSSIFNADEYEKTAKQLELIRALIKAFKLDQIDLDNKEKKSTKSGKDPVAQQWEERIRLMKEAKDLYDQYKEIEGADAAGERVKNMEMFQSLFNEETLQGFLTNFDEVKKEIIKILSNEGDQGKLKLQLQLEVADGELKRQKEYVDLLNKYADKRVQIEEKYNKDIEKLQKGRTSENAEKVDAAIARAEVEKSKELMKNSLDALKQEPEYTRAFEDLKTVSSDTIEYLIGKFSDLKNSAAQNLNPSDLKEYTDILTNLQNELTSRNTGTNLLSTKVTALADARKKVADLEKKREDGEKVSDKEMREAKDDLTKAEKEYADALEKTYKEWENLGNMISDVAKNIPGIGGDILGLIGDITTFVSSSMNSLEKVSKKSTQAISDVEKASVILAVLSAALQISQKIDDLVGKLGDNAYAKYEKYQKKQAEINKLKDAVNEYERAVLSAQQKEKSWFGDDSLGNLRQSWEVAKKAQDDYFEKLNQQQAKYQNKKGKKGGVMVKALGGALFWDAVLGTNMTGINDSYERSLVALQENLRFETQKARNGTLFRRRKNQKTVDLREWARDNYGIDLFDENGKINVELAKNIIENYGDKLVGETKASLESLIELQEAQEEFKEELRDYVNNLYDPFIDDMIDGMWDWYDNGVDALSSFKDKAGETFRDVMNDMLRTFIVDKVFGQFDDKIYNAYERYSKGEITETELGKESANIMGSVTDAFQSALPVFQAFMNSYGDALKELGFDMKSAESSYSSLAKGIEGVTEDTANLLGSYINGIRADVSVQRKLQEQLVNELMPKSNYIAEAQLTQLSQIQRNTAMNVTVLTEFRDLFRRATTPGSGVRVNV